MTGELRKQGAGRERTYVAIDLKSFYASVECGERGVNPLTTNLVVADRSRTDKTICLAVSPSLKAIGIPGRARLFEVVERVNLYNAQRLAELRKRGTEDFSGSSTDSTELRADPSLRLDYIAATPRMAYYMNYSAKIYNIYLLYISGETGITATAGIGTNLYLAKIAMDIVAKHIEADEDGVRIAELNERSYREKLWGHKPITDFWRVGKGYANRLRKIGILTMGDVARCSVQNEDILYRLFGVNAELLIDHAWGWEPCTIAQIKAYKPAENSIGEGQVLSCAYTAQKGRLIVREMMDKLVYKLVDKGLVTDHIVLSVGYDIDSLEVPEIRENYKGEITKDWYGRLAPKHAHGSVTLDHPTSSSKAVLDAVTELFFALLIDRRQQLHILGFFASLQIAHVRCLLLRDEMQNMFLAQVFQDHIQLLGLKAALAGDKSLVDEIVIDKQSTVVSQQGGDDFFLVGCNILQPVEFVAADGEHQRDSESSGRSLPGWGSGGKHDKTYRC